MDEPAPQSTAEILWQENGLCYNNSIICEKPGRRTMRWNGKRYHTLDYALKNIFGEKVIKLSLDGGFSCPNRDGTTGSGGCIFCSGQGSGDFAGSGKLTISQQIAQQKALLSGKWAANKYIAYFQNYTNTYAPISVLRERYEKALACEGIAGLAIATRPDCVSPEVADLLQHFSDSTFLWVELGLQTIHPESAAFINRGYDLDCFLHACDLLRERRVRTVVHLIMGLPGESRQDMLETVRFIARLGIWGVKFHMLYIQKDTRLFQHYCNEPFALMQREEYAAVIADALELLPAEAVIHRVTGDGDRRLLVEPMWTLDKRKVLARIDNELALRNSYQGARCVPGLV